MYIYAFITNKSREHRGNVNGCHLQKKKLTCVCVTHVTICSYYYVYPWQNNKQKSRYLRTKCVKARGISSNPLLRTKNKGHTYLKITQQPKHTPATHLRVFPYSKCTHRVLRASTKKKQMLQSNIVNLVRPAVQSMFTNKNMSKYSVYVSRTPILLPARAVADNNTNQSMTEKNPWPV